MSERKVLQMLTEVNALILNSHIVYTSSRHGTAYVNKDAIYPHTAKISYLCKMIALHFADEDIDAVIAPALGGIILSQWVAHYLSEIKGREILGVYAEKAEDGSFIIKRGYDKLIAKKNVLVVEDVLTTGTSAKKVIEATRALGSNVLGLGVLCNRGKVTARDVSNPPKIFALINLNFETWEEENCPLCRQNKPINTDVGKGREYLSRRK